MEADDKGKIERLEDGRFIQFRYWDHGPQTTHFDALVYRDNPTEAGGLEPKTVLRGEIRVEYEITSGGSISELIVEFEFTGGAVYVLASEAHTPEIESLIEDWESKGIDVSLVQGFDDDGSWP